MALAASSRRSSNTFSRRRLLIGLALVSVVVVFTNAFVNSVRKPRHTTSATLLFVDSIRQDVSDSNAQAAELGRIRDALARPEGAEGSDVDASAIKRRMDRLNRDVNATKNHALGTIPDRSVRESASLLWATMSLRARATSAINSAIKSAIDGDTTAATTQLQNVNGQLGSADSLYEQFRQTLQQDKIDAKLPDSVWLTDPSQWSADDAELLIATWRSNMATSTIVDPGILTVVTDPTAIRTGDENGTSVSVLPPQKNITITVVVGNLGNVTSSRVPLRVTVTAADGTSDAKNDTITLRPGQKQSITFKNIRVVPDGVSTITVDFGPVEGDGNTANNQKVIAFTMNPSTASATTIPSTAG